MCNSYKDRNYGQENYKKLNQRKSKKWHMRKIGNRYIKCPSNVLFFCLYKEHVGISDNCGLNDNSVQVKSLSVKSFLMWGSRDALVVLNFEFLSLRYCLFHIAIKVLLKQEMLCKNFQTQW